MLGYSSSLLSLPLSLSPPVETEFLVGNWKPRELLSLVCTALKLNKLVSLSSIDLPGCIAVLASGWLACCTHNQHQPYCRTTPDGVSDNWLTCSSNTVRHDCGGYSPSLTNGVYHVGMEEREREWEWEWEAEVLRTNCCVCLSVIFLSCVSVCLSHYNSFSLQVVWPIQWSRHQHHLPFLQWKILASKTG